MKKEHLTVKHAAFEEEELDAQDTKQQLLLNPYACVDLTSQVCMGVWGLGTNYNGS